MINLQDLFTCNAALDLDERAAPGPQHLQNKKTAFSLLLRVMKLSAIFLLTACIQVRANGFTQTTVTLSEKNASLEKIFKSIEKQTDYTFFYKISWMRKAKNITIEVKNLPVEQVLELCFKNQPLTYSIAGKTISVKPKEQGKVNNVSYNNINGQLPFIDVKGRVVNENDDPVEGVTVTIKGTTTATTTNKSGEFSLASVDPDAVLVFTHISLETFELKVSGKSELAIRLKTKISSLGDVMVTVSTGYQDIPKERATGSFSKVDNSTLNQQTGTNILQRLNNVTSGLIFNDGKSAANGAVPSKTNISIRGLSTIYASTDPLIVLDNFIYEGDFSNINPNDIESITVLKDAAAASIWGARAGNGVIVITTKKGRYNQKPSIEFNANTIITEKPDIYYLPQMAVSDYIDVERFLFRKGFKLSDTSNSNKVPLTPVYEILLRKKYGQISAADSADQIDALKAIDSRDQFDKHFYQRGIIQQYSMNVKGGSANSSWMFAGALDKSVGTVNQKYNKGNIRIENGYRISKNMQLTIGAYYTNSTADEPANMPNYNSIKIGSKLVPYLQISDDYGNPLAVNSIYRGVYTDTAGRGKLLNWKYYPVEDIKHDRRTTRLQEIIANVALNYQILKSLSASLYYQYQNQWSTIERNSDIESFNARNLINLYTNLSPSATTRNPIPLGGILQSNDLWVRSQNVRTQLNYKQSWNIHSIYAIFGGELREVIGGGDSYTLYGYNADPLSSVSVDFVNTYPTIVNGRFRQIPGNPFTFSTTNNRYVSLYGNALYSFNNKYSLSASARKDGSNLFGATINDKWRPLWSVGMGWNLSNEKFYKFTWIPELRLKASYGYSGNIDPRKTPLPILAYASSAPFTGLPYAQVNSINNPGLSWETVSQLNFGVEFSSEKSIVTGSIEFYEKKGTDLYGQAPYDYTAWGRVPTVTRNTASMSVKGIDVIINTRNIDKQLKWITNILFTYNTNKTTSYYTTSPYPVALLVTGNGDKINPVEGKPLYAIAAYNWGGLNANGDPQGYLNDQLSTDYGSIFNGSSSKGLESGTFSFIGSAAPIEFGSIINSFDYKGFALTFNIGYRFGYYFRKPALDYNALFNSGIGHNEFGKRWQKPGDEAITNVPSLVYTDYPQFSNRNTFYTYSSVNVLKGDHIRFNYLNLAYTFKSLSIFRQLQVYLNSSNLGIIWRANKEGIDPDYPNSIPPAKIYTIGIRGNL